MERRRRAGRQGLLVWALFVATIAAWWFDAPQALSDFLNNFSLFYLVGATMTAIHESGHALMALLMGVRVRGIQLGADGPAVISLGRDRFTFRLLLFPLGGKTFVAPAAKAVRSRHLLIAAAGPLLELAVVVAAWRWDPVGELAANLRDDVLIIGALSLFLNLLVPLRRHGNDASAILGLIRMGHSEADAIAGMDNHDVLARRVNAHVRGETMTPGELEECRASFVERMNHPGLDGNGWAVAANNVASVNLLLDRPELLAEADEISQHAYELLPVPAITATRGAVLSRLGRHKEGIALLRHALGGLEDGEAGSTLASLCLASLAIGNVFEARRYFAALNREPNVPAYEQAVQMLGPAELDNVLRWYWTPDRSAAEAAWALAGDDRKQGRLIATNLERYLGTASQLEIAELMGSHGWARVTPAEATRHVREFVEALRSATR